MDIDLLAIKEKLLVIHRARSNPMDSKLTPLTGIIVIAYITQYVAYNTHCVTAYNTQLLPTMYELRIIRNYTA